MIPFDEILPDLESPSEVISDLPAPGDEEYNEWAAKNGICCGRCGETAVEEVENIDVPCCKGCGKPVDEPP